ncbi:MAG: HPP family protein [Cyanobacteriota bacterium]
MVGSWLCGLLAITTQGLISRWSHYGLGVAPFGASTVLLFGHRRSPLAQPRNILMGNLRHGSMGDGVGRGTHDCPGQRLRCLHPPAGAVALLGVWPHARPGVIMLPVFVGSLLLTGMAAAFSRLNGDMAAAFSRLNGDADPYPHHWLSSTRAAGRGSALWEENPG